jgi:PAP2 superfamily
LTSRTAAAERGHTLSFGVFVVLELVIWAALYAVYFIVRGQTIAGFPEALANARQLVDLERATGLHHEHLIQDLTNAGAVFEAFFARYYELAFFPVVVGGLLLLAYRDRGGYRELRTAMLLSIAAATVVFATLPTAPPRLVPGLGLADTVGMNAQDGGSLYGVPYNPYAAMPSMHVGWTLLVAIGLYAIARSRPLRVLIAAHPVLMTIAVVATGNHYLLDAVVGAAIALAALAAVRRYSRAEPDRPPPRPGRPQPCLPTT